MENSSGVLDYDSFLGRAITYVNDSKKMDDLQLGSVFAEIFNLSLAIDSGRIGFNFYVPLCEPAPVYGALLFSGARASQSGLCPIPKHPSLYASTRARLRRAPKQRYVCTAAD